MKKIDPVICLYAVAIMTSAVALFITDTLVATVFWCVCAVTLDTAVILHLIRKIRKKETVWRWCMSMVVLALAVTLLAIGEVMHLS